MPIPCDIAASCLRPARWAAGAALAALLALAAPVAAHENVPGLAPVHPDITPEQAAFDRMFWDIDDGAYPLATQAQTRDVLSRLEQAIPAGDLHRRLQYRYMHCLIGFHHVATGAVEYAREGVQLARVAGDDASEAALRLCLGGHLVAQGDQSGARAEVEHAAQLARRGQDYNVEGLALVHRGRIRMDRGELALALQDLLDAQDVFERGKVRFQIDFNLFAIAQAYRRMGEPERALEYIDQVLAFGQSRDDTLVLHLALLERGRLHQEQQRYELAAADYRRALALADEQGSPNNAALAYLDLASLHNVLGEPRQALLMLERAVAAHQRADTAHSEEQIAFERGRAYALLERHAQALAEFDRALPQVQEDQDLSTLWQIYRERAHSRERLGDLKGALSDLHEYGRLREQISERLTDQRVLMLSHRFDARQRDLQNARLRSQRLQAERLAAAERRERPWRYASLGLGLLLVLLLSHQALRQARQHLGLRRDALTDPLTGTANRRGIEALGLQVLSQAPRLPAAPCLILMDLDHFKQVNDRYGHAVGDQVLVRTAAAWHTVLRHGDHLGRLGGEEFLAILHNATEEAGQQVADRLLEVTRALDFSDLAPGLTVTVSLGLVRADGRGSSLEALLQRADAALYRAKAKGRDRIEIASSAAA